MKSKEAVKNKSDMPKYVLILGEVLRLIFEVLFILFKMVMWSIKQLWKFLKRLNKKYVQPKTDRIYEAVYHQACNIFDCEKERTGY